MTRYFSNVATPTTLASGINNTDSISTITVADALVGWPGTKPFTAVIDRDTPSEEMVLVTAVTGTIVTATRAVHGYGKFSHSSGAAFEHCASAQDLTDHQAHVDATASDAAHIGLFPALYGNTPGHVMRTKMDVYSGVTGGGGTLTFAHGMGGQPDGVVLTNAYCGGVQAVVTEVHLNSTNITVLYARVTDGSTAACTGQNATVSFIAWRQL